MGFDGLERPRFQWTQDMPLKDKGVQRLAQTRIHSSLTVVKEALLRYASDWLHLLSWNFPMLCGTFGTVRTLPEYRSHDFMARWRCTSYEPGLELRLRGWNNMQTIDFSIHNISVNAVANRSIVFFTATVTLIVQIREQC